MPKTLLKWLPVVIGVASFGVGIVSGVFAGGVRVGQVETRVTALEECSVRISAETAQAAAAQDERLRQVEAAVATIPAMAEDIREMRAQVTQILTLLATTHRPDRS